MQKYAKEFPSCKEFSSPTSCRPWQPCILQEVAVLTHHTPHTTHAGKQPHTQGGAGFVMAWSWHGLGMVLAWSWHEVQVHAAQLQTVPRDL